MLERPERLLLIATILLLLGCILPFFMVTKLVRSSFFLNFLSFGASVLGLFLGIIGVAMHRVKAKDNNNDDDYYRDDTYNH